MGEEKSEIVCAFATAMIGSLHLICFFPFLLFFLYLSFPIFCFFFELGKCSTKDMSSFILKIDQCPFLRYFFCHCVDEFTYLMNSDENPTKRERNYCVWRKYNFSYKYIQLDFKIMCVLHWFKNLWKIKISN